MNIIKCTSTANTTSCNRVPKYLVIHYTANTSSKVGTAKGNANYFAKPTTKASADFIVDDGSIVQYNPDPTKYYCWSVGGSKYPSMSTSEGGKYYGIVTNSNSISIEMCSCKTNKSTMNETDTDWYLTDATINNAIELAKHLMQLYNIPISNIVMHHHVTGKRCPNPFCVNEQALAKWNAFKNKLTSGASSSVQSPTSQANGTELYRVRKSWNAPASQIGAFGSLDNAKKACKDGYHVYDSKGNAVYPESDISSVYQIKPTKNLDIYKTAGGQVVRKNGAMKGIIYTIVETQGEYGKLKSGAGWISVSSKDVVRI